jgi:CHAD domain-containing protein
LKHEASIRTLPGVLKRTPTFDLKSALRTQLEAAIDAFENLKPDDAIHRGRVALKRARALARLAQHAEPALAGQMIVQIRPIMQRFSEARDLAALEACAKRWAAVEKPPARAALTGVARRIAAKRKTVAAPALSDAVEDVRRLIFYLSAWPDIPDEAIARGAARLDKRARKGFARAMASPAVEVRHTWRKRAKERFYAIFLLDQFWPSKLRRRRVITQRLGETLGQERDIILLLDVLRSEPSLAGSPDQADRAHAALSAHREALMKRGNALGRKLHD